jgi:hypothetical protein
MDTIGCKTIITFSLLSLVFISWWVFSCVNRLYNYQSDAQTETANQSPINDIPLTDIKCS